jgi:predicted NBD/HSP70 family sugar kinase
MSLFRYSEGNDLKPLRRVRNNVGDHLLDRQSSTRVRVLFEEMSQGHEQLRGVFDVAFIECLANVIMIIVRMASPPRGWFNR